MKTMIAAFTLFVGVVVVSPALAVTCQVLEGDGVPASGKTKKDAEKAAWEACISRKVAAREHLKGPASVDDALADAEPCLNAKLKCQ